ncbi:MAG: methyltransferase [Candidatus Vogelbacteria bacterium]|nr:methyltransferase [Candidatus Vogelbacteria bacterium]
MKTINKKLANLEQEINWLKRDKYRGVGEEVGSRVTRSNFARRLESDISRLKAGEPLDYVIGWREFLGCKIDLSEKPLIPREETEFWVGEAIKQIGNEKNDLGQVDRGLPSVNLEVKPPSGDQLRGLASKLKVLDLFAGSGGIGLAVLKHCPNIEMTFGEKDPKLCEQIKKNLKLNGLKGRVIQTDIFQAYRSSTSISHSKLGIKSLKNPCLSESNLVKKSNLVKNLVKFDVIFANPPYVPARRSSVQKSVKKFEPALALWGGACGLFFIDKFLAEAQNYLKPGGRIFMEFGHGQKGAIEKLLKKYGYKNWQFKKDQFERWRYVVVE